VSLADVVLFSPEHPPYTIFAQTYGDAFTKNKAIKRAKTFLTKGKVPSKFKWKKWGSSGKYPHILDRHQQDNNSDLTSSSGSSGRETISTLSLSSDPLPTISHHDIKDNEWKDVERNQRGSIKPIQDKSEIEVVLKDGNVNIDTVKEEGEEEKEEEKEDVAVGVGMQNFVQKEFKEPTKILNPTSILTGSNGKLLPGNQRDDLFALILGKTREMRVQYRSIVKMVRKLERLQKKDGSMDDKKKAAQFLLESMSKWKADEEIRESFLKSL